MVPGATQGGRTTDVFGRGPVGCSAIRRDVWRDFRVRRLILIIASLAALAAIPALASAASGCSQSVCFQGAVVNSHRIKPRTLFLTVDGTLDVFDVNWSSWGSRLATGHGIAEYHGCTPSCGQGRVHRASVVVRLSEIVACDPARGTPNGLYYNHVRLIERSGASLDASYLHSQQWAPCEQVG